MDSFAYTSTSVQLLGALITVIGLGRAWWKVRGVLAALRRRRESTTSAAVGGATSEGYLTATATITRDWTGVPVEDQLEAIHRSLLEGELATQALGGRVSIVETQIERARAEVRESEARSAKRTDDAVQTAVNTLRDDSKIDLAVDVLIATVGVGVTVAGMVISYWAI